MRAATEMKTQSLLPTRTTNWRSRNTCCFHPPLSKKATTNTYGLQQLRTLLSCPPLRPARGNQTWRSGVQLPQDSPWQTWNLKPQKQHPRVPRPDTRGPSSRPLGGPCTPDYWPQWNPDYKHFQSPWQPSPPPQPVPGEGMPVNR